METITHQDVINYYNECWLSRFETGHNPKSYAMHLGYFSAEGLDNDTAKLNSNEFLAHHIGIPDNKEIYIADFGCGIGGTCIYFAQKFPKGKISGINISSSQIDFANRIKREKNINGQLEYVLSDYSRTNLGDSKFDFVIGVESICHAHDKLLVYKEACRILKPGGTFAIMDYFEDRLPENEHETKLLDDFRNGWVAVEYLKNYKLLLPQAGYSKVAAVSILDKVKPGINHSYTKAAEKINSQQFSSLPVVVQNHLKACLALKELTEKKIIDYKIITALK